MPIPKDGERETVVVGVPKVAPQIHFEPYASCIHANAVLSVPETDVF
jgi:hypothetical protein